MDRKIIRLSKSCISEQEKTAVAKVLDKEYLGMGTDVQHFEEMLSEFFGRPAVCVVNGTASLHLALQACNIGVGDEVLVPSLTYVASFQAISATGAKPIACDIDEETCVLDWRDAQKRITSRTKAIMPVHYCGGVGDLEGIYNLAAKHNLRVVEDAAHAFGTLHKEKRIGSFGDVVCFSFDGIKNITSGEGGCIVSSDEEVISKLRDGRLLGVEKDTKKRFAGQRSWEFDVTSQGWRYHMSNIMGAIGKVQFERFPGLASKRQQLAFYYDEMLSKLEQVTCLQRDYHVVVPHIYVIKIKGLKNRKALQESLESKGIQTGIHYQPNHQLSFYNDTNILPLPITDKVYPTLLTLPLHPDLSIEDVEYVCTELKKYLDDA